MCAPAFVVVRMSYLELTNVKRLFQSFLIGQDGWSIFLGYFVSPRLLFLFIRACCWGVVGGGVGGVFVGVWGVIRGVSAQSAPVFWPHLFSFFHSAHQVSPIRDNTQPVQQASSILICSLRPLTPS